MKKITTYTTIFLAALLLVLACKKEKPEISGSDICNCESPVSADFEIFETGASNLSRVLTDHILGNSWAAFRAKESDAAYKWYIGSEILTDREVARKFQPQWENYDIPITLVVEKEPNLKCFPNDDGYDSVTKIMHVFPRYIDPHLALGTFRVAEANSIDSFNLTVDFEYHELWQPPYHFVVSNYDGNGTVCTAFPNNYWSDGILYRRLRSQQLALSSQGCNNLTFSCYFPLPGTDTIEIDVNYRLESNSNSPFVTRKYFGRRI